MIKNLKLIIFCTGIMSINFNVLANVSNSFDLETDEDIDTVWVEPESVETITSSNSDFQDRLKKELKELEIQDKKIDKINELSEENSKEVESDEVKITHSAVLKNPNQINEIDQPVTDSLFIELDPKSVLKTRRVRSR